MIACIDNVFNRPHKIMRFADTLEYTDIGYVRGLRSKLIHEINQELFDFINMKILRCFYPEAEYEFFAKSFFQKNQYDINDGWVHSDSSLITAIIYLTPEDTSGTCIYEKKDENQILKSQDKKQDYFKNYKNYSTEEKQKIQDLKLENNSCFKKTVSFTGKFNRLIAFDSKLWHASELQKPDENRLTIISFIEKINKK